MGRKWVDLINLSTILISHQNQLTFWVNPSQSLWRYSLISTPKFPMVATYWRGFSVKSLLFGKLYTCSPTQLCPPSFLATKTFSWHFDTSLSHQGVWWSGSCKPFPKSFFRGHHSWVCKLSLWTSRVYLYLEQNPSTFLLLPTLWFSENPLPSFGLE